VSEAGSVKLRIGTRDSKLARLQTDMVVELLSAAHPAIEIEIVPVTTHGDKVLNKPIADLGTRGVFVKELEEALLDDSVDLVVHSLKDLPTDLPSGLKLAAVLQREDPRDVFLSRLDYTLADLPAGSKVATSSRRRSAQLKALRPDLEFVDVRGNIPTRLTKLDQGQCDAMVLAAAGLLRLNVADRVSQWLDPHTESTPAVGQGALAIECREDDEHTLSIVEAINDAEVFVQVQAERAFLDTLGGGCSVPIGALCTRGTSGYLMLIGCIASLDGTKIFRESAESPGDEAQELGRHLAKRMASGPAGEVLESLKASPPNSVSAP
jgi:hydroxymethylbilane synthase